MKREITQLLNKPRVTGKDIGRLLLKNIAYSKAHNTTETPLTQEVLNQFVQMIYPLEFNDYNEYRILHNKILEEYYQAYSRLETIDHHLTSLESHMGVVVSTIQTLEELTYDKEEEVREWEFLQALKAWTSSLNFPEGELPNPHEIEELFVYVNAFKFYIKCLAETESISPLKAIFPSEEVEALRYRYQAFYHKIGKIISSNRGDLLLPHNEDVNREIESIFVEFYDYRIITNREIDFELYQLEDEEYSNRSDLEHDQEEEFTHNAVQRLREYAREHYSNDMTVRAILRDLNSGKDEAIREDFDMRERWIK